MDKNFGLGIDPGKLAGNLQRRIGDPIRYAAEIDHLRDKKIADAAESLNELNEKVAMIDQGLVTERKERKAEDEKNMKYTKRMDLINLVIAILGLAVAVVGVVVAFIALK